jgi:Rps23 Pro-64 3,4-dihydroxylase Tpa1-like proline 4-hydroxylase
MDQCVRERFVIVDDFLPEEDSLSIREDIEKHFSNPDKHSPSVHQVWNYWYVPASYTYLRTTPEKVIAREKVQRFVERLRTWSAQNLGFANVTWPYLSLYVPGCVQGLHNDSTNGRLGFVYSLTPNSRQTIGGETVLVQDRDLFRSNLNRAAAGIGLYDLVPPQFNRLILFDDRIPHAVQRVDGSMDPLEGRIVLHGHISEAGVVAEGALRGEVIQATINDALAEVRDFVDSTVNGPLVFQLEIGATGKVEASRILLDRLASSDSEDLDALRGEITERIGAVQFPSGSSSTLANVPLIF